MRRLRRLDSNFGGWIGLAGLAILAWPNVAEAINPPRQGSGHTEFELDARAGIAPLRETRTHTRSTPRAQVQAQAALESELGSDLVVSFDAHTGVADWLIPAGKVHVSGASNSAAAAEHYAAAFLARHLDALAPGAHSSDFVLVSDTLSLGLRTLGYAQLHAGREVIGGQLSFSFRADTLVAVRSQALPHVQVPPATRSLVGPDALSLEARTWISQDFAAGKLDRSRVDAPHSAPALLPLIHPDGRIEYREVVAVDVRLDAPLGHWTVWVDAHTAQPIARRSLQHDTQLQFSTYARSPLGPRIEFPANTIAVSVDGQNQSTNKNGALDLVQAALISFSPSGIYASMANEQGPVLVTEAMIGPNGTVTVDHGDDPLLDAQISAYVHTAVVKDHIRGIDPGFAPPDLQTAVTVNIDDVCNAFADENTINFFAAGGGCQNTALLADVIYHEYGHVAHVLGIQPGVGIFDGGVSEGASDYLSSTIVDNAMVGVGFFLDSDEPLRDLDPPNSEWHWPEDGGEVHDAGRIIGGTLWDLRKLLIQKYDENIGVTKVDEIWLGGIQRSVDMPSWYLEALITNDDDGNLQNGTPDACEIREVFGVHGLGGTIDGLLEVDEVRLEDGSVRISLNYEQGLELCAMDLSPSAILRYRSRPSAQTPDPQITSIEMVEVVEGLFEATIPTPSQLSVTNYQLDFEWSADSTSDLPDNPADEWYELWTGETTEIWCADFNVGGPEWSLDGEWSFGMPEGLGGDPEQAWAGLNVAGVALGFPGSYAPWTESTMSSPTIDVSGYESVRLQYRRWLNVEDGYWDQAQISANGSLAWQNLSSPFEGIANVHHRDREWRFHDLELTPYIGDDGELRVSFSQISDGGLEFGGWTIDSMCIVGHGATPTEPEPGDEGCGDGYLGAFEQCDDGNLQNGDGCSSGCLIETEPVPEPEPEPELGWDPGGRGCGCTFEAEGQHEGGLAGFGGLALLALFGLRRRKN